MTGAGAGSGTEPEQGPPTGTAVRLGPGSLFRFWSPSRTLTPT
jgi:hypothetical protein